MKPWACSNLYLWIKHLHCVLLLLSRCLLLTLSSQTQHILALTPPSNILTYGNHALFAPVFKTLPHCAWEGVLIVIQCFPNLFQVKAHITVDGLSKFEGKWGRVVAVDTVSVAPAAPGTCSDCVFKVKMTSSGPNLQRPRGWDTSYLSYRQETKHCSWWKYFFKKCLLCL